MPEPESVPAPEIPARGVAAVFPRLLAPSALLFLALLGCGLLLRLAALGLPLEGTSALLATRGELMGNEQGWTVAGIEHQGPLLPMLLAVPVASGLVPTAALRWTDALLGACLAPLLTWVLLRLGHGRPAATAAGLFALVHPLLLLGVGGPSPGTAGLSCVMLLLAIGLLATGPPGRGRHVAFALALLLPLADPLAAAYVPGLFVVWARGVRATPTRVIGGLLVLLFWLLAPLPGGGPAPGAWERWGAPLLQWLPLAALLGLLVGLPRGVGLLWRTRGRAGSVARAWLAGASLHALLLLVLPQGPGWVFGEGGWTVGLPLVLPLVAAGSIGLVALAGPRRRRIAMGAAIAVAGVGSVVVLCGPLQRALAPEHPLAAGRLGALGRAMRNAAHAAGPGGQVALDLGVENRAAAQRLGDLAPMTGILGPTSPAEASPEARGLARLTRWTPEVPGITTLDGRAIYRQQPVARYGPWVVLALTRPP